MSFECFNYECEFLSKEDNNCGQFTENDVESKLAIIRCENRISFKQKEMCESCTSKHKNPPCERDELYNHFVCSKLFNK